MKYCYFLIAVLSLSVHADEFYEVEYGEQPNHLTPLDYPPNEYDLRLAKYLFVTEGSLASLIFRPSFEAESCLAIHEEVPDKVKEKHGGWQFVPDNEKKYFITFTRASDSLWHSMPQNNSEKQAKEVEVSRIDREISAQLAIAIHRVWARMLQQTKYPATFSSGLDGNTYQFSVWLRGLGNLHGETWSPDNGLLAEFVSLGEALAEFSVDKTASEENLLKRLKTFDAKIPKA